MFNIFLNDIFYIIDGIYNYADDNTLSRHGENLEIVKCLLEEATVSTLNWFSDNQMQANVTKFQAMILGANSSNGNCIFEVSGAEISPSSSVKLLGVEIDDKLSFCNHISNICSKASRQINALARLSRLLDVKTKLLIFNSFIVSNFNYCPLVWHHCSKESAKRMEKIQERGLRFVYNDASSSYADLLIKGRKNALYVERIKKIALFVYKCINQIGPSTSFDLYENMNTTYNLRDKNKLVQPKVNTTTFGLRSLRYSGASLYNQLPNNLKESLDLNQFKNLLKSWVGPTCKCGICVLCTMKP